MAALDLIIFGASGDLSARKLFPALFQLERLNLLGDDLRIAAVAVEPVGADQVDQLASFLVIVGQTGLHLPDQQPVGLQRRVVGTAAGTP